MQKLLEDLWESYQAEETLKPTQEEQNISARMIECEKSLRKELTFLQKNVLEEYVRHLDNLSEIYTRQAFVSGIRFATRYLLETLFENSGR